MSINHHLVHMHPADIDIHGSSETATLGSEVVIRGSANSTSNTSPSGILRMPNELLVCIFEHGGRITLQDLGLPFAVLVSHVSRHWRALSHNTPAVWSSIPVRPAHLDLASIFLDRSNGYPLSLCLHVEKVWKVQDALALVLSSAQRWLNLYIRAGTGASVYLVITHLKRINVPRLEHFELTVRNAKPGTLGWLPPIFDPSEDDRRHHPSPKLRSVCLQGISFRFRSGLLSGLTSLTLAYLPRDMAAPMYSEFRELLRMSPNLVHLKLADVFPQVAPGVHYSEIEMRCLSTLDIVMHQSEEYVQTFFGIIAAPSLRTLKFESKWSIAWEGFESAIVSVLAVKFGQLRALHLTVSDTIHLGEYGVNVAFYDAFPELRQFSLNVLDDQLAQYFLKPWAVAMSGGEEDDFPEVAYPLVWPKLELLTVRAPYDEQEEDEDSIDDTLELIGSLRLSLGLPFDVFQACVFADFQMMEPLHN
ncbi:hypothetical protein PHLCEN_2v2822 [Hermanssonia centrifuga]|uniref:Uncharacterized protein n=1 Tax=Hermanssonia centrifuga TaxID=98765 RepID=A0A2R6RI33_9APHY|nr:hypothetical protein PHLCEN_2v2822 [Hermanssonia centrifuga]